MKKAIDIVIIMIVIHYAYANDSVIDQSLTHTSIGSGDQTFYEQVSEFNRRLSNPSEENVKYISKRIIGIPENHFVFAFGSYLNRGAPKLLLVSVISKKQDDKTKKSDYHIVCSLYEKLIFGKNPSVETHVGGWIQGDRRYDAWQKDGELWKVSMNISLDNVDVNNLQYQLPVLQSSSEAFKIWKESVETQNIRDKDIIEKVRKLVR
jgi:hypothetical protein